jgi:ATP-dependent Clp protease ATP-binding subunit ClpA
MFERFTESARAVLVEAQDVAVELGSRHIDACHLLYGCAEVRDETAGRPLRDLGVTGVSIRRRLPRAEEQAAGSVDPEALRAIGVDYEAVRAAVEQNFGPGSLEAAPDRRVSAGSRRPPFTPEAKRSLELALRVAIELRAKRIAPGHLLLGLLRLDDEDVVAAIERSGTTVAALSAAVLTRLSAAA